MKLVNPVTINPPSFTRPDGTVQTFKPFTLTDLDITIIDNNQRKSCVAQIRPCPKPLVLWEKQAYDTAGDYTQAMVEARVKELLGNDPKKVLEGLFVYPTYPKPNVKK